MSFFEFLISNNVKEFSIRLPGTIVIEKNYNIVVLDNCAVLYSANKFTVNCVEVTLVGNIVDGHINLKEIWTHSVIDTSTKLGRTDREILSDYRIFYSLSSLEEYLFDTKL